MLIWKFNLYYTATVGAKLILHRKRYIFYVFMNERMINLIKENVHCVYIHRNKVNGKIYVGQTGLNVLERWNDGNGYINNKSFYSDIIKYGWNEGFCHEIVYKNLSDEDADKKEKELIQKYKSFDQKYGYNHTLGGKGLNGFNHSLLTREKMSKSKCGKYHSELHKHNIGKSVSGINNYKARKVLQCDLSGNVIRVWDYIKQAETELHLAHGAISACCRGVQKTAYGYIWRYAS